MTRQTLSDRPRITASQAVVPLSQYLMRNMNAVNTHKLMKAITLALLLGMVALVAVPWSAGAAVKPGAKYAEGNLSLEARNANIGEILEILARVAGIDIFVARGFQTAGKKLSVQIKDEPLEAAIKRILRGYNYAAIYTKEGNDFRIAALRLYPEGQHTGEVVPLFSGGRTPVYEEKNRRGETVTVLVNASGDVVVTLGNLMDRRGALGPSQTEVSPQAQPADLQAPWFSLQLQLEQAEAERFNELLLLRRQVESTTDAKRREAMAMAYADEVAKFHALKNANLNKIEAMKRVNQFQDVTKN